MPKVCKCAEAEVFRGIGLPGSGDRRFEIDPDPQLSANAAAAHNCAYIKRRNTTIRTAEQNAHLITRAEAPGETPGTPRYETLHTKHFHAEMNRLDGTPPYRTATA